MNVAKTVQRVAYVGIGLLMIPLVVGGLVTLLDISGSQADTTAPETVDLKVIQDPNPSLVDGYLGAPQTSLVRCHRNGNKVLATLATPVAYARAVVHAGTREFAGADAVISLDRYEKGPSVLHLNGVTYKDVTLRSPALEDADVCWIGFVDEADY